MDDDDDRMESSYAQVQREEFISKKLGKLLLPPLCLARPSLTCLTTLCRFTRGSGGHAQRGVA